MDIQILFERQQEVQELADEYARVYNTFADLQDLGALQAEQCQDIDFDPAVNVDAAVERTKQGMKHLEAVRCTHLLYWVELLAVVLLLQCWHCRAVAVVNEYRLSADTLAAITSSPHRR